jgi:glucose dehydrogenase
LPFISPELTARILSRLAGARDQGEAVGEGKTVEQRLGRLRPTVGVEANAPQLAVPAWADSERLPDEIEIGEVQIAGRVEGDPLWMTRRQGQQPAVGVERQPRKGVGAAGEVTAATQPFPTWPPPLVPQRLAPEDAWGLTPWDRRACAETIRSLRSEGVFTPPSFEGSVLFPGTAGGSNWGSVAWDPVRKLLVANTNRIANTIQLVPREEAPWSRVAAWSSSARPSTTYLRAFDVESGAELWRGRLPAGGQATPMTYRVRANGRQFVVIAAGGHAQMRSSAGDSLIAFALP